MISRTYGTVTWGVTEGLKRGPPEGACIQPETGPLSGPPGVWQATVAKSALSFLEGDFKRTAFF